MYGCTNLDQARPHKAYQAPRHLISSLSLSGVCLSCAHASFETVSWALSVSCRLQARVGYQATPQRPPPIAMRCRRSPRRPALHGSRPARDPEGKGGIHRPSFPTGEGPKSMRLPFLSLFHGDTERPPVTIGPAAQPSGIPPCPSRVAAVHFANCEIISFATTSRCHLHASSQRLPKGRGAGMMCLMTGAHG
ncbi:hypothetical protein GQ53DRAFT_18889 [Thozetella sp. PMI_491]|nr:hypothetical protein GQ53DRAFT_18889 [Thozetella sp. PMI_491]